MSKHRTSVQLFTDQSRTFNRETHSLKNLAVSLLIKYCVMICIIICSKAITYWLKPTDYHTWKYYTEPVLGQNWERIQRDEFDNERWSALSPNGRSKQTKFPLLGSNRWSSTHYAQSADGGTSQLLVIHICQNELVQLNESFNFSGWPRS